MVWRPHVGDALEFALRRSFHHLYPWTGLNGLDRNLLRFLPERNGIFIEAGANDGLKQSNTYFLERCRGWSGLLIEPVPRLANRCRKVRNHSVVEEVLLVGPEQSNENIEMLDLDLMSVVSDQAHSNIDLEQHVADAETVQGISRRSVVVRGVTLSALIDKHLPQRVDLLSLDVEGFEMSVLRGLDIERHQPRWIVVETKSPETISAYLSPQYELQTQLTFHDYLFKARV